MMCCAVLCDAMLRYAALRYAMRYDAMLCYAVSGALMLSRGRERLATAAANLESLPRVAAHNGASHAMSCYAMPCHAMLCYAMLGAGEEDLSLLSDVICGEIRTRNLLLLRAQET